MIHCDSPTGEKSTSWRDKAHKACSPCWRVTRTGSPPPLHPSFIDSQSWMRDVERGTSEKNVNTPLSSALDLPFPFPDTWMGPMVQHCNVRQNYQPIKAVKAQCIFHLPANNVRNAPFFLHMESRKSGTYIRRMQKRDCLNESHLLKRLIGLFPEWSWSC